MFIVENNYIANICPYPYIQQMQSLHGRFILRFPDIGRQRCWTSGKLSDTDMLRWTNWGAPLPTSYTNFQNNLRTSGIVYIGEVGKWRLGSDSDQYAFLCELITM